jgi:hypothetical protein
MPSEPAPFFTSLPKDLGRGQEIFEKDPELAPKKKSEKFDQTTRAQLIKHADEATRYYFGNYDLPLEHFGPPDQKYANRNFDIEHAEGLVKHWGAVGVMFPDKLAVVCAFEVRVPIILLETIFFSS